ncbi:TPA: helix-turn-helix transcriptional regulator [Vibrio parahaemolyticus]|uniref:helix-turn-helix domain-containing protein n=1 Tax=Vibrio TaxID=662 RepID=UPI00040C6569|nr:MULTISPECIES: helix-turn-helix transcriptional regulator [Vibrio]EGR2358306.1 XRE family transcriptional regulator [Vibrio parahaemolyticus]EGR3425110.1 XRE family transcriptional regulator [Vibrio parahaemolyticus]EJE3288163.1 helix-turn-helix transcriptional regulator [Vibrio alginolyticus]ELA6640520.1 helix-turn-helix transcriptional regulator [Vibrio alginolyticus]ELA7834433.1 helix-turn-helix transcriptional regulator [Vibrio alginolyticus]
MNYTNELLDAVKAKYELTSEYKLAQKLDVNHSRLYCWRKGKNSMDWEVAFKIADMLNLEDQCVVSGLIDDKYKNPRLINALHQISAA